MRRLSIAAVLWIWLAVEARAERIRVTSWNLRPSRPTVETSVAADAAITGTAEFLRALDSDVLLLQEVRDRQSCEALVRALGAETYSLLVISEFSEGANGDGPQKQLAIVSKYPALVAKVEQWPANGHIDLPGGFLTAVLNIHERKACFYCVHLKNNTIRQNFQRDNQLNILKRERSAENLLLHISMTRAFTLSPRDALIVGGNFNTSPDQSRYVSEATVGRFLESLFINVLEDLPESERITCPGRGRYPNVTFDYIFAKNATAANRPTITRTSLSDHFPVTCEFELDAPLLSTVSRAARPNESAEDVVIAPTGVPVVSVAPIAASMPASKNSAPWLLALSFVLGAGSLACWRWSRAK